MANTYTALHYHLIFSTKNREGWIAPQVEQQVWAYMGAIARDNKMTALCTGGVEDHVHLLVTIPPALAVSKVLQLLKGGSSKWIHDTFPKLRSFAWQDGYGAFTVSKSQIADTIRYIEGQRQHHQKKTFPEEYLDFLQKHQIEFDERFLWG